MTLDEFMKEHSIDSRRRWDIRATVWYARIQSNFQIPDDVRDSFTTPKELRAYLIHHIRTAFEGMDKLIHENLATLEQINPNDE